MPSHPSTKATSPPTTGDEHSSAGYPIRSRTIGFVLASELTLKTHEVFFSVCKIICQDGYVSCDLFDIKNVAQVGLRGLFILFSRCRAVFSNL